MKRFSFLSSPLVAGLLVLSSAALQAQTAKDSKELSDAERARRDAEKVFSFIKFHTVKPAAPAQAPAAAPAPQTAAPRAVARSVPAPAAPAAAAQTQTQAQSPIQPGAAVAVAQTASPSPSAPVSSAANVSAGADLNSPAAQALPQTPEGGALPAAVGAGMAAPSAQTPPPQVEPELEAEEAPLKLIAYTPPEMNAQILAAMNGVQVVVPVRFTVQPNGVVSAVRSMGSAPRRVSLSAVRAVQQWRFEPIAGVREVDVEIAFKVE